MNMHVRPTAALLEGGSFHPTACSRLPANFHPSHITPHAHTSSGGGAMEEPGSTIPLPGNLAAAAPILTDDAAAVFSSAGLSDVLRERLRQVEEFGHTPAADAAVPLIQFQIVVQRFAHAITGKEALPDRAKLRRKLVQLAAFCLAFIDRLDRASTSAAIGQQETDNSEKPQ